jgi:uncharacterized protein (TIGR02001 family)
MKKSLVSLAVALLAASAPSISLAEDSTLAYNVGVVNDYRYRGISQTRLKPALQGGVDYGMPNGIYLGAWGSTIKWIKDAQGDAPIELDLYGGWKGEVRKDMTVDVGLLRYQYFKAVTSGWTGTPYSNPNTTEVYGALTWGPATAKISYALGDLFGNVKTSGSYYAEAAATIDVAYGVTLTPHVGYQKVKDMSAANYADIAVTLAKDFNGVVVSLAFVDTSASETFYVPGVAANSSKYLGRSGAVLGVKYNF